MNVADALQPKNFSAGEVIVRQGDPADGMFFVEDGIAEVHVEQGAGNRMKVNFIRSPNKFKCECTSLKDYKIACKP